MFQRFIDWLFTRLVPSAVPTYRTNAEAQSWTSIGNKGGMIPQGYFLHVTGDSRVIKDRLCWEIAGGSYQGLWIEPKYLDAVEEPPTEPPSGDSDFVLVEVVVKEVSTGRIFRQVPGTEIPMEEV